MEKIRNKKRVSESNSLKKYLNSKKGVSPVVATVLLIVIVIVIGLIIFLWFRSFMDERCEKTGRSCELVCDDVEFSAQYNSVTGSLTVSNRGNVPIYDIGLKITEGRSQITRNVGDLSNTWPSEGLREGESFSDNLSNEIENPDEILAVPVLTGKTNGERMTHTCEDRHGQELI